MVNRQLFSSEPMFWCVCVCVRVCSCDKLTRIRSASCGQYANRAFPLFLDPVAWLQTTNKKQVGKPSPCVCDKEGLFGMMKKNPTRYVFCHLVGTLHIESENHRTEEVTEQFSRRGKNKKMATLSRSVIGKNRRIGKIVEDV